MTTAMKTDDERLNEMTTDELIDREEQTGRMIKAIGWGWVGGDSADIRELKVFQSRIHEQLVRRGQINGAC